MNKCLIVGNGFIASHFNYAIAKERLEPDAGQISRVIEKYKPDVIINCIGFCGNPNIDQCEINKSKTLLANTTIPTLLAIECNKLGIKLINIGSGCIFSGEHPKDSDGWKEGDFANPQSYYSYTKYATDLAVGSFDNVCTLRIRMPLSDKSSSRNFISKVANYNKVIDIQNSMTIVGDLVRCVDWVIENDKQGIYHMTNPGTISASEVMHEYNKYMLSHKFSIISGDELNLITKAKRSNCILNSDKLSKEGFEMENIVPAMKNCVKTYFKDRNVF